MFIQFWKLYPARNGKKIGKGQCKKLFDKLSESDQNLCLTATENYAKRQEWPVDPIRFFKSKDYPDGLWKEWVEPEVINEGLQEQSIGRAGRGRNFAAEREDERRTRIAGICGLNNSLPGNIHQGDARGKRNQTLGAEIIKIP
jgi:hypothetical protein